jgi:tetratricopeptide (TPR) repeat protein
MYAVDTLLRSALAHHRERRLIEAEALYREILETEPGHKHALSMLGLVLMNRQENSEAEALFLRHLEVDPGNPLTLHCLGQLLQGQSKDREAIVYFQRAATGMPNLAPIFNDLAVSLNRTGKRDEALIALDRALDIDPCFGVAHQNRGNVLYECSRFLEAIEAYLAALRQMPVDEAPEQRISALLNLSRAASEAGEFSMAEQSCRAILEIDADNGEAVLQLANVLYRLRRDDEAISILNQLARTTGLVSKKKVEHPEATILILGGVGASHVPTRYLFDPALFATQALTLLSPDQSDAPLGSVAYSELAEADLIFNSLGEVEKDGGHAETVRSLLARLGKPVLNLPDRIACTGRDRVHELFGDIPGLVLPNVRWLSRDQPVDLVDLSRRFLIRPAGAHGGVDLALIENPTDLKQYLAKAPYNRFLLTDFHDFKALDGYYRKYRFIFVDRQPFPYHLAIADNWLVHYWRAEMAFSEWKKMEEEEFLTDWRNLFGPKSSATIDHVASRMDLDYGGMDCSVLPNGDVLFFEANACMLVHLDDEETNFPYKHQAVPRIRDAVTRMIRSRIV